NVDAGITTTAEEVKAFLVRQVASPVRWTDCIARLAREGGDNWVEVGPGRVLSGLLKRTLDGARGQAGGGAARGGSAGGRRGGPPPRWTGRGRGSPAEPRHERGEAARREGRPGDRRHARNRPGG